MERSLLKISMLWSRTFRATLFPASLQLKIQWYFGLLNKIENIFLKIWNNLLQKIEFDVRVFANGKKTWPLFMGSASSVSLSAEPLIAYETFRDFYLAKHNNKQIGRRLTLQPALGSASIEAVFYGSGPSGEPKKKRKVNQSGERHHLLNVTTFQMCVLMQFNAKERLTYEASPTF